MTFTATITSQGQITIPAKIREQLNLDASKKVILTLNKDNVILESEPNIAVLEGIFKRRSIKNKSINQIIRIEKKAIEDAIVERYQKRLKKMGIPTLK